MVHLYVLVTIFFIVSIYNGFQEIERTRIKGFKENGGIQGHQLIIHDDFYINVNISMLMISLKMKKGAKLKQNLIKVGNFYSG